VFMTLALQVYGNFSTLTLAVPASRMDIHRDFTKSTGILAA